MNDLIERQSQINKLQENLASIRKIAGWTSEILGTKIGVTKQTISNLENRKTTMNFTQYIAIRSIIDAEIENNKDSTILRDVVKILLDSENELDEEKYEEVQKSVEKVAATAAGGITGAALFPVFIALVPLAGGILSALTDINWKKILK